jgi:hypothetical protein
VADLMLVANPKRRRKRKHARRRNPHRRHHARRRRSNPHRRHHARRRRNPSHRRVRRYSRRRNPASISGLKGMIKPVLMEGLVGAGGALMLDAAWGYINPQLPTSISSSPYMQFAVKCLAAIGVGFVGGKLLRGKGRDLAVGGVTVAMHDMLKSTLQSSSPTLFGPGGTLALSGYGHMGAYLSGSAPIVGTATFPRTYQMQTPGFSGMGAYLSGSTNDSTGNSVYDADCMGQDYWDAYN